ncbi:hypothetical protein [Pedobacter sp. MW01-1-1]|uniref:hypothetical protein n=1 Tax=Pedobacter sp. MW01-1-1 TaxID=3383027 RepID=UPI003FEEE0A7
MTNRILKSKNMSGPKKKSDKPGSNYEEEVPKGREPVDHKTVRKPNDSTPNKAPKSKNPAKTREQSEQPVHPIKDAPKE